MVASPGTAVTRQAAGCRRQGRAQGALRFIVADRAAAARACRRRESPGRLRGVRPAARKPWMQHGTVEVRSTDLAHRSARHAAARHPC